MSGVDQRLPPTTRRPSRPPVMLRCTRPAGCVRPGVSWTTAGRRGGLRNASGSATPPPATPRRPRGHPLPADGRAREARPLQPPSPQPAPDVCPGRASGPAAAARAPDRTGTAGRPTRHRRLHRPPRPRRNHLPALSSQDRATGEPVRRHDRSRPGELVHTGAKKPGRIPDGGGRRKVLGRTADSPDEESPPRRGTRAPAHCPERPHPSHPHRGPARRDRRHLRRLPHAGHRPVRRTRHHDRTGLTDNAWAYSEDTGRRARHDLATSPRWARHWRPRTKGEVGRFHRLPARRCPTPRRAPTIRRAARPPRRRSSRRRPGRRRSPSRRSASGRRSR
ncbi:hypothetical protein SDIAM26S_03345 [Streptomyces diastaticus subsp. diastaticus]